MSRILFALDHDEPAHRCLSRFDTGSSGMSNDHSPFYLIHFPGILQHNSIFTLFSISGFWILAHHRRSSRCHQLEHSICTVDPQRMTTENEPTSPDLTLVFDSAEELQTRLVLLPRVEEEGIGAVVHTFVSSSKDEENSDNLLSGKNVQGAVVEAILVDGDDADSTIDLKDLEFSDILAELRSTKPPVKLRLAITCPQNDDDVEEVGEGKNNKGEQEEEEETQIKESTTPESERNEPVFEEEKKIDPSDIVSLKHESASIEPQKSSRTEDQVQSMQNSLMSWASRLSATSVQLATERAQQAMEVAAERRKVAAAVMASSLSPSLRTRSLSLEAEKTTSLEVDLFIQTSSGAFLPLPNEKQKLSSELRVTNSSLLTVRKSATEACSPDAYSFQWFRSLEYKNSDGSCPTSWIEMEGATSRTFQPTATEVGHKIRCLVTKLEGSDSDDDESDDNLSRPSEKSSSVSLETLECVAAASAIFNGARQALVNGAQFGGITGRGNAVGRTFRIKVAMLISKDPETKKSCSTSSLCFYQVSGSTSEPIHPEEDPITGVTACVDHESAKGFELIFPDTMPETASMVMALATNNRLKLSASNRLGRESLLLAIGIANYNGEPSALGPCSVLYSDMDAETTDETTNEEVTADAMEHTEEPGHAIKAEKQPNSKVNGEASTQQNILAERKDEQRIKELEKEMAALRSKLSKKDKALNEAQKQANSLETTNRRLAEDLLQKEDDLRETKKNLLIAERRMQSQEDDFKRVRSDHTKAIEALNREVDARESTISELEKSNRILQNEKAVLTATVEARDSKLSKMSNLQATLEQMKAEVAEADSLRDDIRQTKQKNDDLMEKLKNVQENEKLLLKKIEDAQANIRLLEEKVKIESKKAKSCRTEFDTQQIKIQKLKAERNSYKQKSDSLSKEIARVCRQGRTIKDVEKIISDDAARRQEVELLREQKRKALEDLNHYRTSFEQSRAAQRLAGMDSDTSKILERNVELERVLSELTEYVSAKEMQLETLRAVNETLQEEIKELHRTQMSKNLGKNDV